MIRLRAINCKNVASFADRRMDFGDGLTLVIGKNESGKSTLIQAVAATIFGVMGDALRPVGHTGAYGAAIRIETPKGIFVFDRNFEDNHVKVYKAVNDSMDNIFDAKVSPRGRSADYSAYIKLLQNTLGLADRDLFEASALVQSQDMGLGDKETVRKIKQLLAGQATHDTDAILDGLKKRYFDITSDNPFGKRKTKPRLLEEATNKRTSALERRADAEDKYSQCIALQSQIASSKNKLAKLRKEEAEKNRVTKVAADFFKMEDEKKALTKKHKGFSEERETVRELSGRLERKEKDLANLGMAADISDETAGALRSHITLSSRIEELSLEKEKATARLQSASEFSKNKITAAWATAGGLLLIGLILSVTYKSWQGIPAFVAAAALGVWAYHTVSLRKTKIAKRQAAFDAKSQELANAQNQIDSLAIPEEVMATGPSKFSQLLADRELALARRKERDRFTAQLEVLPTLQDLNDALSGFEMKIAVLTNRQEDLAQTHPELKMIDQDSFFDNMQRLNALEESIENLSESLHELENRYAALAAVTENPESLDERIYDLSEQIETLELRRDAIFEAIEAVTWAVEQFRGEYLQTFSKEVGDWFAGILDDDARRVFMDNDLVPGLHTPHGPLPLESLSAGTKDQLYFACRVALASKLTGGASLPFILDDPMSNFDKERKSRTVDMLLRLAKKHQVLLFSHDEELPLILQERGDLVRLK